MRRTFLELLIIVSANSITCAPLTTGSGDNSDDGQTSSGVPRDAAEELVLAVGTPALTVIEYADFQCPYCGQFARETFPTIRAQYIETGKVRWVFRHYPLTNMHPYAWKAAEAAQCANEQGAFWAYHGLLFNHQDALQVDRLKSYASDLSLDRSLFDSCLDGGSEAGEVQDDVNEGLKDGVSGTPTFVINGHDFVGTRSVQEMSDLLDGILNSNQD